MALFSPSDALLCCIVEVDLADVAGLRKVTAKLRYLVLVGMNKLRMEADRGPNIFTTGSKLESMGENGRRIRYGDVLRFRLLRDSGR